MEQMNKVELRGYVGNVRISDTAEQKAITFSLVTNYAYVGRNGGNVESTWHNVVAWPGRNVCDFSLIEKGRKVEVSGRLRTRKYVGSDGLEHSMTEIVARKLTAIEGDESLAPQVE